MAIARLSTVLRILLPDTEMYRLIRDKSPGVIRRAISITRQPYHYHLRIVVDEIISTTVFIMGELFDEGVFLYDLE